MYRYIYHQLPSGEMMFDLNQRCPHYRILPDSDTDHDYFLTCSNSKHQKEKRLVTLTIIIYKLHIPLPLHNLLIHHVDKYYNNELMHDLPPNSYRSS